MLFKAASELMKNQKHSDLLAPDKAFEVLQTITGESLFFSIATNDVLYVTREISKTDTGWTRVDLSSQLAANYGNQPIRAKSFALSQDFQNMTFDIVLVITVNNSDYLYASLNHANTPEAWRQDFNWSLLAFDAEGENPNRSLSIADVYLMNIPTDGNKFVENCFVDILRAPGTGSRLLDRYYIKPSATPRWKLQHLDIDLDAGSIQSSLGISQIKSKTKIVRVPGIYTFGTIGATAEVGFFPQYDPFDPENHPPPTIFGLPSGVSAITSCVGTYGFTTLFAASISGLLVYTAENQKTGSVPTVVVPAATDVVQNLFAGVTQMSAMTLQTMTTVWCLNANRTLFYVTCPAGSEGDPAAWSTPVPLQENTEGFAFYINGTGPSNVLFVHVSTIGLVQLTQIPSTGLWERRKILLPAPDITALEELNTFTTHVQILTDVGGPAVHQDVFIRAVGRTAAYINNTYYSLDPQFPVVVSAGPDGTITVVQEATSLTAVCLEFRSTDSTAFSLVDPFSNARQILSTVGSGADLRNQTIPMSDGQTKPLIPTSIPIENSNSVASALNNLLLVSRRLPVDGSPQTAPVTNPGTPAEFGISYNTDTHLYKEVARKPTDTSTSIQQNNPPKHSKRFQQGSLNYLKVGLGDLINWMDSALGRIEQFAVHEVTGFWHLVIKVAGEFWGAVLDCTAAVAKAVEFIFNKIKVAFEDLIAWLGFLFGWADIIRTHKVIKNIIKQHANELISSMGSIERSVQEAFQKAESQITAWANLSGPSTTVGNANAMSSDVAGASSPQSSWAVYHTKNGVGSATSTAVIPTNIPTDVQAIVDTLEKLVEEEADNVKQALQQVKTEIADNYNSLSAVQIIKRLAGIVGVLLKKAAEDIVVQFLEISKLLIKAAVDLLDAPLNIPIISPFYSQISGGESLSVLDLMCLVGAVPATVMYKIATGNTPFPDSAETNSLINAPNFSTIIKLMGKTQAGTLGSSLIRVATSGGDLSTGDKVLCSLNIASFFGGIVNGFASLIRSGLDEESSILNYIILTSSYVVLLPNISSFLDPDAAHDWSNLNIAFTFISASKIFIDNVSPLSKNALWSSAMSPFIETYIDIFWLIPLVGTFVDLNTSGSLKTSDVEGFVSGCVDDLAGICTPLTVKELFPELAPIMAIVVCSAYVVAGGVSLLSGMSLIGGN